MQIVFGQKKDINESQWYAGLKFRSIGPAVSSGRISDFAVNPEKPWEYYVAVASGGVWKTINSGINWQPVFDDQPSFSIGCMTMDPHNHHIVWVGTGENNGQRSVSYGDGVYRTDNGGESWKNMGLKESKHISRIVIDPIDSDHVYVAAQGPLWNDGGERGVYETIDGGNSWKAILTISPHTGVTDLVMDPRNQKVLYAAAYQRRRHVHTFVGGGPESAVYKTTDGGKSWSKLEKGLPKSDMGKIGLAISPVNPDIIYAIIEAADGNGGFFRSSNRGASWHKQSGYVSMYPMYYQELYPDPSDINTIYSMDTYTMISEDGGKSFRRLGNKFRHVDDHALWIDPHNTQHLLIGGDGGIYETYDRAENWHFKENLPVTQFYRVSVDNDLPFYNVYGGTQDNATLGGPSRTLSQRGILNSDWYVTVGGDGFETQIDPENPDIVYSQWQNGNLIRYDRKSGEVMGIKPREWADDPPLRWNWDSPLLISPHKSSRLYFAANKLFRSDDYGNSWTIVSEDLTRQIDRNTLPVMGKLWGADAVARHAFTSFFGNIVAISESPLKEGLLYVGTDDGLIQISEDGGGSWRKIAKFPAVPEMTYVSCLLASQHEVNTVYATFYNYKNGDYKPYVLRSTNKGNSWKQISSDLPENGPVYTIAEDHQDPDLLFLGTEFGLFCTLNTGNDWIPLNSGLPPIAVRDLAIQSRENDLAVATFGRGFYLLDDYTPLRHMDETILEKDAVIFPIKDALMFIQTRKGSGPQGSTLYSAANPPFGATITYFLRQEIQGSKQKRMKATTAQPIDIEKLRSEEYEQEPFILCSIADETGEFVRHLRAPAKRGINRITWDLRYASPEPVNGDGKNLHFSREDTDLLVMPGEYFATLSRYEKGTYTAIAGPEKFITVPLATSTLPAKNRAELVHFQKQVRDLRRVVLGAVSAARETEDKLYDLMQAVSAANVSASSIATKIEKMLQETEAILRELAGDTFKQNLWENTEASVSTRVQQIVSEQWRSTSAPTTTQRQNLAHAEQMFIPLLQRLRQLVNVDLRAIERELDSAGAPWTPGRLPQWKAQ
jgi:photosystem II stability/assembly factor-like uncharacterized protein